MSNTALAQLRCRFTVRRFTGEIVWITDDNTGRMSVTNDAEAVCKFLDKEYGGRRIICRDSDGNWDELLHKDGRFAGFKPARDLALVDLDGSGEFKQI